MRIELDSREKELIHKYWYVVPKNIKSQLVNKRRKTVDIEPDELKDLIGYLSLECNHCNSNSLAFELDELCEKLEYYDHYRH
ncbi:hypothetical protein [Methylotuvimicrobium buryatense]|uniref:Uncharacterized protein n=1 Tax=Methylotuvimicrobium buryatense TaxID=95641 RepID=A0A4V1IK09_METBY|nr:hypothetical protein [Methylotuvimicrobium buryatense]QCW83265.1 hypothetical protein EQU24_14205 [Methylotuvimicrobium buryatense]